MNHHWLNPHSRRHPARHFHSNSASPKRSNISIHFLFKYVSNYVQYIIFVMYVYCKPPSNVFVGWIPNETTTEPPSCPGGKLRRRNAHRDGVLGQLAVYTAEFISDGGFLKWRNAKLEVSFQLDNFRCFISDGGFIQLNGGFIKCLIPHILHLTSFNRGW